jgi:hypothetical protein
LRRPILKKTNDLELTRNEPAVSIKTYLVQFAEDHIAR